MTDCRQTPGSRNLTEIIDAESLRVATVLAGIPADTPVPTRPGWTTDDLIWHLVYEQLFWAAVLAAGATTETQVARIESSQPTRPTSRSALMKMRERATADLLAALLSGPSDAPAWTWWPADQRATFIESTQAYEATICRVDAELAAGSEVEAIDPDLASDGVRHILTTQWANAPAPVESQPIGIVHINVNESHDVELGVYRQRASGAIECASPPEGPWPTATVSGSAPELFLWAWGRPASVHIHGDLDLVAAVNTLRLRERN